ncbi:MucB/RseB C-terminal domain-containing protein [Pseudomonadota bacterium]
MRSVAYKVLRGSQYLLPLLACVLVAARAGATTCPEADTEALAWLDKMSRSINQVSYHGVVTFQRGEDMQAMKLSHFVADGLASERLIELTGQGAEVLRVDHPLECVHPGHRLLRIGAELQAGRCGIADYYRFRVADGELVAGRQAVQVRIEPRDMYRYGYVMELDRETGLLLKSQTLGRGGKVLEKFQFASLSYAEDQGTTGEAQLVHRAHHPHPAPELSARQVASDWNVDWLPLGFTLTDLPQVASERRTYTDGLAVFSVFLEPLSQDIRPGEGVVRTGGTTSYTRGMHLAGRPVLVTVIGEVPLNTARMVADSIVDGG